MMTRSLFAFAVGLSGCSGCNRDREQQAPLPSPPPFCIPAFTMGTGDAGRGPSVEHLEPSDLDGIFPPRWKKGDEWLIHYDLPYDNGSGGEGHQGARAHFRVASVPSDASDFYRIEVRYGSDVKPFYVFTVRGQDFSVASVDANIDAKEVHLTPGAHPFVNEAMLAHKFPLVLPSVAPERVTPYFFEPEPDRQGRGQEGWQTVFARIGGEELAFQLVSRDRYDYRTFRVVIEWRRGEPWWSSAKCWLVSELGAAPRTERPFCDAKLIRDPAPTPTK